MTTEGLVAVTITGPSAEGLAEIVHNLVESSLAACGNIIPGVRSIYRWDGALKDEPEALALIHTRTTLLPDLYARVSELHPYAVPQIVATDITSTTKLYGGWIADSTR